MATSKFLRTFRTTAGAPITTAAIWLVPQANTYPTGALALTPHATRDGQYYRDNVPDGEYKIYIDPAGGSSPTLYEERLWVGDQRVSTISDNFDATDSYKLKPSGMKAQTKTVTSTTSPTPDYIGQMGIDANGNIYIAIALTGTMWKLFTNINSYLEPSAEESLRPYSAINLSMLWFTLETFFDYDVNLFDKTRFIETRYLDGSIGRTTGYNANYRVSHFIKIKPNVSYKKSDTDTICWYDINGNFISSVNAITATSPANAYWARIAWYIPTTDSRMFCEESKYPNSYTPFKIIAKSKIGIADFTPDLVSYSNISNLIDYKTAQNIVEEKIKSHYNLFDQSRILYGKYLNQSSGVLSNSVNYSVSHYIKVDEGQQYATNANFSIVYYNKNLNFISVGTLTNGTNVITTPANCAYVRTCFPINTEYYQVFKKGSELIEEYIPYEETIEYKNLPRAIKGVTEYNELNISLISKEQIEEFGGTVVSGTVGVDAAIQIPFNFYTPIVVDFEFKMPFDIHSGQGDKILAVVDNGKRTDGNAIYKVGIKSVLPATSAYVPTYPSGFFVKETSYAQDINNAVENIDRYFNGMDAFSVRKNTPTSSDLNIILEVTDVKVRIYNGGTTIGEWLFGDYTTLTGLINQMIEDLGANYTVRKYYCEGYSPSDLARFSAYLCKSQEGWNVDTDSGTGSTIYDSYETFVPVKDLTTWRRCSISFYDYGGFTAIDLFIDGKRIYSNYYSKVGSSSQTLYLNCSPVVGDQSLNASVRNLRIYRSEKVDIERFAVIMTHNATVADESDGGGSEGVITSGRLKKFFAAAHKYGWQFITMKEFIQMLKGHIPKKNKVIVMTMDDGIFNYETMDGIREIYDENNVKVTTAIITDVFDFISNADMIKKITNYGHEVCIHCDKHGTYEKYSYAQFITAIQNSLDAFSTANLKSNVLIYSYGSSFNAQRKWYRNNGFAIGFSVGAGGSTWKTDNFNLERYNVDDGVYWANVLSWLSY